MPWIRQIRRQIRKLSSEIILEKDKDRRSRRKGCLKNVKQKSGRREEEINYITFIGHQSTIGAWRFYNLPIAHNTDISI